MKSVARWLIDVSFRPPKQSYDSDNTISVITNGNDVFVRIPIEFTNHLGDILHGTLWIDYRYPIPKSCLIFLHSLGTNQFECLNLVPLMCSRNLAVFSFDFPGCGNSGGSFIPLDGSGVNNVLSAVQALEVRYQIERFGLWGRSMGASIAIHTASVSKKFSCVVSDSAFQTVESVVRDHARNNGIPDFVLYILETIIKQEASESLGTNVDTPYPYSEIPFSTTPLFMGHGKNDTFISPQHAQNLFDSYGHPDKQLYLFEAQHNSSRPYQWYDSASRFILRKLGITPTRRCYQSVFANSQLHSGNRSIVMQNLLNIYNHIESNFTELRGILL